MLLIDYYPAGAGHPDDICCSDSQQVVEQVAPAHHAVAEYLVSPDLCLYSGHPRGGTFCIKCLLVLDIAATVPAFPCTGVPNGFVKLN